MVILDLFSSKFANKTLDHYFNNFQILVPYHMYFATFANSRIRPLFANLKNDLLNIFLIFFEIVVLYHSLQDLEIVGPYHLFLQICKLTFWIMFLQISELVVPVHCLPNL